MARGMRTMQAPDMPGGLHSCPTWDPSHRSHLHLLAICSTLAPETSFRGVCQCLAQVPLGTPENRHLGRAAGETGRSPPVLRVGLVQEVQHDLVAGARVGDDVSQHLPPPLQPLRGHVLRAGVRVELVVQHHVEAVGSEVAHLRAAAACQMYTDPSTAARSSCPLTAHCWR